MAKMPQFESKRDTANYWDKTSVAEHLDELEEVEVTVRKPLSHTLSVRIDSEDLKKLQALAKLQGVGITTMARVLLRQVLRQPDYQLFLQALGDKHVQGEVIRLFEDSKVPPGEGEPTLFVIPNDRLERVGELISNAIQEILKDAVKRTARVSPQDNLYRPLSELVKS